MLLRRHRVTELKQVEVKPTGSLKDEKSKKDGKGSKKESDKQVV